MIKAIIFDEGGVIVLNKVDIVYQRLAQELYINYEELMKLQKNHNKDLLTGRISCEEFAEIIKIHFDLHEGVLQKWKELYYDSMPVNYELLKIVEKLKNNYKVGIISNIPDLHAQLDKNRDIFSRFQSVVLSCEIGVIKPQKEIFGAILKELNLLPEECVLIDDRREHLKIPKEMGFQVIHFKDNKQFIENLKELDINF